MTFPPLTLFLFYSTVTKEEKHLDHPPDGAFKNMVRTKTLHYRTLYTDRPDPIVFMTLVVSTSVLLYHDFILSILLYTHRESSTLLRELPEESD